MFKSDLNLLTLKKIRELKAALNLWFTRSCGNRHMLMLCALCFIYSLIEHKQILTVKLDLSFLYIFTFLTTSKFCSRTKLSNQPNNIRDEHGSFVFSLQQQHHRHVHHMLGAIRGHRDSQSARFAVSAIRGQRDSQSERFAVSAFRGHRDSQSERFAVSAIRG